MTPRRRMSQGTRAWYVVVVADSKGEMSAMAWQGRDPADAAREIERLEPGLGTRWLLHWEHGFADRPAAETRADVLRGEIGARAVLARAETAPLLH